MPTYNAYSIDGDVTAPLVYVNYGVPEDYEALDRLGVSVKGAIAIARYGGSWRGIKPKVAAEHGAVGCLIYSDPRDDGYFKRRRVSRRAASPGGWRAARQRDGYARLSGRSADAGRGRDEGCQAAAARAKPSTLTKIPVLPISYGDAQPLLAALKGADGARRTGAARCRSPITWGRARPKCILKLEFNWDTQAALRRDRAHSGDRRIRTSG